MHHHALILKHPPDHPAPPSRLLSSSTYLPLLSTTYSNLSLLQHLLVDSPHDNYDALVLCSKRSVDALAEIHYDPSLHPATKHFCVGPSTKTHLVDHVASDPSQVNVETSRNERATADLLAHKIIEWCRTSSSSSSTSTTTTADPHDVDDAESSTALPRPLDSSTTTMTTTTTGSQSTRTKTTRTKRILFLTGDKTRDSLARILRSHSRSSSSSSSHTTSNSTSNPTSISNSKDDDDELAEEPLLELETLQVYETTYRPEFERDLVDKLHEIDRLETTSRRRRNDQDRTMMTIAEEQQDERPVDANNEDYKVYLARRRRRRRHEGKDSRKGNHRIKMNEPTTTTTTRRLTKNPIDDFEDSPPPHHHHQVETIEPSAIEVRRYLDLTSWRSSRSDRPRRVTSNVRLAAPRLNGRNRATREDYHHHHHH
ncbi:hypothetical protein JCM10212_005337 [Sporobolomyces blumeae]